METSLGSQIVNDEGSDQSTGLSSQSREVSPSVCSLTYNVKGVNQAAPSNGCVQSSLGIGYTGNDG